MNVDIGTIKRADLRGGDWAGGTPFDIKLECSGGVSVSGYANINTSFSGTLATNTSANQGVLLNEKTGNSAAKGVGVQVIKDNTPLEFNKKYNIGTLQNQKLVISPCLSMRASINMRRLPVPVKWSRTWSLT